MQHIARFSIMDEFEGAALGDRRLTRRLCRLAAQLAQQPDASIPKATGAWSQVSAAYRFLDNDQVSPAQVLAVHRTRTLHRAAALPWALAVSDTTTLNFGERAASEGLGPIGTSTKSSGLLMHGLLAFSPQAEPLGVLAAPCWSRDRRQYGRKHQRHRKPVAEKESAKWLRSFRDLQAAARETPQTRWVLVADREADLYELFGLAQAAPQGPAVLVRANHNRRLLAEPQALFAYLAQAPLAGQVQIQLPRRAGQKARTATLAVRFCPVTLRPPPRKAAQPALTLWAVEARELHPPQGQRAVHWQLLTSLPVASLRTALEKLQWYCVRWGIEVFHRVLKSGCAVEEAQLETAARLERYVMIKVVIAWQVLALVKVGRVQPDAALSEILEQEQWQVLAAFGRSGEAPRDQVPTMREGINWLGKLGGHLGRRGDGPPGPLCLAHGLERLQAMRVGWRLAQATQRSV